MRARVLCLAVLALAACDSGAVPSPAERQMQQSAGPVPDESAILLGGQGVTLGSQTHYFSAEKSVVERELTKALGAPIVAGENEECGAGPMTYSSFPGELTVNYQNDRLVGWSTNDAAGEIRVAGDVQVGTLRAAAEAASGYSLIVDSSLGEEFILGGKLGGFMDGDRVSIVYAGTQCFFR